MRLIDADALIEAMEERKKIWLSKCEYNDAIREVKEAPTVERPYGECATCKHRSRYTYCRKLDTHTNPDFFCGYHELKEEYWNENCD